MAVLDVRQDGRATVRAIDCLSEVSCNDRSLQSLPGDRCFRSDHSQTGYVVTPNQSGHSAR